MSISQTTLSGACAVGDVTINVASATGFAKRKLILIDSEFMAETADVVSGTTAVPIRRGDQGTYAIAHPSGTIVQVGDPNDFPPAPPGERIVQPYAPPVIQQTYTAAGAITVPTVRQNCFIELFTGTAGAMTLALPTYAQEGQEVNIMARDAQAYTVTTPTNGYNGSTHIATFGGAIGDNFRIKAVNLSWNVLYSKNVTIT